MYNLENIDEIANNLDNFEKVCAITIALRIADGSCKMNDNEKRIFMALYNAITDKKTDFFNDRILELISIAPHAPNQKVYAEIKQLRESAMSMITRPRMKVFKELFRQKISE